MDKEDRLFTISHKKGAIVFENHSDDTLCIYAKPVKPKRKIHLIQIVHPQSFCLWDLAQRGEINISSLMFSLEKSCAT